jgi:hypothetical protein
MRRLVPGTAGHVNALVGGGNLVVAEVADDGTLILWAWRNPPAPCATRIDLNRDGSVYRVFPVRREPPA